MSAFVRHRSLLPALVGVALLAGELGARGFSAQKSPSLRALDASQPIGYTIQHGEAGTGYRSGDEELATWALEAWQRAAAGAFTVREALPSDALIHIFWVGAGGGLYGEMVPIEVNGRQGAAVFVLPDTGALGPDIAKRARADALFRDAIVYLTCLHEVGHGLGLSHTDSYEDVMYYFGYGGDIPAYFERYRRRLETRKDIQQHSGLSENDARRLRKLYPSGPPR